MALVALHEVAEASLYIVMPQSLQLRALLALLWRHSDGDRSWYKGFWDAVTEVRKEPHHRDPQARRMYAQTNWLGIARGLGVDPERSSAWNRAGALVEEHYERHDSERRARDALVAAINDAALTREIIATKGHPHSREARELIARRLAEGLDLEGKRRR